MPECKICRERSVEGSVEGSVERSTRRSVKHSLLKGRFRNSGKNSERRTEWQGMRQRAHKHPSHKHLSHKHSRDKHPKHKHPKHIVIMIVALIQGLLECLGTKRHRNTVASTDYKLHHSEQALRTSRTGEEASRTRRSAPKPQKDLRKRPLCIFSSRKGGG